MKTINRWHDQLLHAVEAANLLGSPRRVQLEYSTALEGKLTVDGREVTITLILDPLLENRLPIFLLRPWDALGFIPHIDPSGVICFLDPEGMVLDQRRQLDIVRECFQHVRRTLEDGVTGANHADFVNEFEVYWRRLTGGITALSNLEPTDEVAEVIIAACPDPHAPLRLARDERDIRRIPDTYTSGGPWTAQRALYMPLEPDAPLVPPRSDRPFWTVDDVRALLAYCSEPNRARLSRILSGRARDLEYLVFRLLRPAGGAALFGVRFDGVSQRHPLSEEGDAAWLTPMTIIRRDRSFLVQRGGGYMELGSKRVLVLGCGSVGGYLTFELARAGVGSLALVDYDTLTPENTYRHVLGKHYWGQKKALAMKYALTRQLPFSKVDAIAETIETALEQNSIRLNEYDLIVSALGNPTSELAINERVRRMERGPPLVFTWLEPLGIGGHAVLTGNGDGPGCFECLYTPPDDTPAALHNRASFAAPSQTFQRSLEGCGSLYTPYGSLDATQTALLAARLALDMLTGKQAGNSLRSWKGDAEAFTSAGFQVSNRFRLTVEALANQHASYASPCCRVCGNTERGKN